MSLVRQTVVAVIFAIVLVVAQRLCHVPFWPMLGAYVLGGLMNLTAQAVR